MSHIEVSNIKFQSLTLETVAKLFIDILIKGYIEPLDTKDIVSQGGTLNQHILLRIVKYFLADFKEINDFDPAYSFIANDVWKIWLNLRSFIQCHNGSEMSYFEEDDTGLWIHKAFMDPKSPDIIIVFIPNVIFFRKQQYIYAEYLVALHGLLQLQGFKNPCIFIQKFLDQENKWDFTEYAKHVKLEMNWLKKLYPDARICIMGESISATLILRTLLEMDATNIPDAALLCSPILFSHSPDSDNDKKNLDYITSNLLGDIQQRINKETHGHPDFTSWKKPLPKYGVVITYGELECCKIEIEKLIKNLRTTSRVKVWKRPNAIHCWPALKFLTENDQAEKEDSCFISAGIISRMLLWHTDTYITFSKSTEPMNVLTIDDRHI